MKKFLSLMAVLVAIAVLVLPSYAEVKDSKVAPAPTNNAGTVTTTPLAAQPDSTIKLSANGNPIVYRCDPSTKKWHVYIYIDVPRAVVWDSGTPGPGPYTIYLAGINNAIVDPAVTGVTKDMHVVEFVVDPCACGGDGLYLRLEAADGSTGWPFTWKHASRANNGTTGGYRIDLGENCESKFLTD